MCFHSEDRTVMWHAMTVTVICEHRCCRDPTCVFRAVCVEGYVSQ